MNGKDCSQPLYFLSARERKSKRIEREARGGEGCMPSVANQTKNRETVDIVKKVVILASSSCYRLVNNSSASRLIKYIGPIKFYW